MEGVTILAIESSCDDTSAAVLRDVIDGFVSAESALADYGVVIADKPGEFSLDLQGTENERSMRKARVKNPPRAAV